MWCGRSRFSSTPGRMRSTGSRAVADLFSYLALILPLQIPQSSPSTASTGTVHVPCACWRRRWVTARCLVWLILPRVISASRLWRGTGMVSGTHGLFLPTFCFLTWICFLRCRLFTPKKAEQCKRWKFKALIDWLIDWLVFQWIREFVFRPFDGWMDGWTDLLNCCGASKLILAWHGEILTGYVSAQQQSATATGFFFGEHRLVSFSVYPSPIAGFA